MTQNSDLDRAQAAVFCAELHRQIELLDARASADAARLRARLSRTGPQRDPALIDAAQQELRLAAVERRRIVDMLAAMGHSYPCRHRRDGTVDDRP